jgi:Rrf2 family protein
MNTNHQFAVSIHILTLLSALPGQALTSEQIAESVSTHSVVIRRIMGQLRKQGLVESRSGASGGWKLSRAPGEIHLCSIYDAINRESLLGVHPHPNADCPIGAHIRSALGAVFGQAEKAMHDSLSGFTVADVLSEIRIQTSPDI